MTLASRYDDDEDAVSDAVAVGLRQLALAAEAQQTKSEGMQACRGSLYTDPGPTAPDLRRKAARGWAHDVRVSASE